MMYVRARWTTALLVIVFGLAAAMLAKRWSDSARFSSNSVSGGPVASRAPAGMAPSDPAVAVHQAKPAPEPTPNSANESAGRPILSNTRFRMKDVNIGAPASGPALTPAAAEAHPDAAGQRSKP